MPKHDHVSAAAALLAASALLALPATADTLGSVPRKAVEQSLPAAAGEKPFTAVASGECENSTCFVDFGKKGNKARTVTAINCGFSSQNGQMQFGAVYLDNTQSVFIPALSRATGGTTEVVIAAWTEPVTVPAGVRLRIVLTSFGDAQAAICNIQGVSD
jgi:hypothetical protein